jgi:hypothetical protein
MTASHQRRHKGSVSVGRQTYSATAHPESMQGGVPRARVRRASLTERELRASEPPSAATSMSAPGASSRSSPNASSDRLCLGVHIVADTLRFVLLCFVSHDFPDRREAAAPSAPPPAQPVRSATSNATAHHVARQSFSFPSRALIPAAMPVVSELTPFKSEVATANGKIEKRVCGKAARSWLSGHFDYFQRKIPNTCTCPRRILS